MTRKFTQSGSGDDSQSTDDLQDSLAMVSDDEDDLDDSSENGYPTGATGAPSAQYGVYRKTGDAYRFDSSEPGRASSNDVDPLWQALGIVAELLFTAAAICALYIAWQMWWTGVQSQRNQYESVQSSSWSDPSQSPSTHIAEAQNSEPPVQPEHLKPNDLIAQIYIPRFGEQWQRTIVEGTDMAELNERGLGHYTQTQLPGQVGNFAVAGHRNGYGQPLGDVDKLQVGDPIVIRTKDYWYVYNYTKMKIVTPDQVQVIAPNPDDPSAPPTSRFITLTTCEPKYSTPTHRWISYGTLKYWAKVSDGVPKELAHTDHEGVVRFINNGKRPAFTRIRSLIPVILLVLAAYLVIFLAAAVVWRWPRRRAIREGRAEKPNLSLYGGLTRLQPGTFPIRLLLISLLLFAAAMALFQWTFPWAAANIPALQQMSNYVAVTN